MVSNGLLWVILVVWVSLLSFPSPICWAVFLNISWHVLLSYLPLKMSCFHSFFWYKCWYSQSHFLNSAPVSVFSYRLQFFTFSQAITEMDAFICTCTRWPKFNIKYTLLRKHELRLFFFKISLLLSAMPYTGACIALCASTKVYDCGVSCACLLL